jgi:hypothetical protein
MSFEAPMRRPIPTTTLLLLAVALLLPALPARADDPKLMYLFVQDALPWHYAVRSDEVGGRRIDSFEAMRRTTPFGFESLGLGLGFGYNGLNLQFDVRNALDLTTIAVTGGVRGRIAIDRLELWARAGIGPALGIDGRSGRVNAVGAIAVQLESGVDVFLVRNRLALGLKAVALPQYYFPANFFFDFALNLGLRLLI